MSPSSTPAPGTTVVLKFGSSVLVDPNRLDQAVLEIDRHLRQARKVVAVVSAIGNTTDALERRAARTLGRGDEIAKAELLATGEARAVVLLNLRLAEAGIDAVGLDASRLGIQAAGPRLDATPTGWQGDALRTALWRHAVVVVPGFVATHEDGGLALLGRGGSDLTALFLAHRLRACCRLLKDVPGLFTADPNTPGLFPRRFRKVRFEHAQTLDGGILQPKALRFAKRRGLQFTVGCCGEERATLVGSAVTERESLDHLQPPRLRVGLLGAGTVGAGVAEVLLKEELPFRLVSVLVRDASRPRDGIPSELVTTDAASLWRRAPEILIDTTGAGPQLGELWEEARRRAVSIISADKELPFRDPRPEAYGASVGGALPALEVAKALASREEVVEVEGVLNGTCNAILDLLQDGVRWKDALAQARRLGYAEADPSLDLDGTDAARKLALLVETLWGVPLDPDAIPCTPLDPTDLPQHVPGECHRQVARALRLPNGTVKASVDIEALPEGEGLASLQGNWNGLQLRTRSGQRLFLRGKGAGRWPTTTAVLGDLLQVARRRWGSRRPEEVQA